MNLKIIIFINDDCVKEMSGKKNSHKNMEREDRTIKQIGVFLFGAFMNVCFVDKEDLLKKDVRYIGTDTEESGMDLYEDIQTGEIFATKL